MKVVLGLTTDDEFMLAWRTWRTFGLPLARVWYVEAPAEGFDAAARALLVGLDPLPLRSLSPRDLALLEEVSQRPMSPS
jgi:hypothetical protein